MALLNGDSNDQERSTSPTQHLGKRKRTGTPEPTDESHVENQSLQQTLKEALQLIKQHDLFAKISRHPLSAKGEDGRTIKRQRTQTPDQENDSIERRIARVAYKSLDDLISDLHQIKNSISDEDIKMNGTTNSQLSLNEQIESIIKSLSNVEAKSDEIESSLVQTDDGSLSNHHQLPTTTSHQVLSLRSQTESGTRQLFSGLPRADTSNKIDGKRLPNGFELTDVLSVDKNDLQGKDSRKFGDVFGPHRNAKTLEMPRGSRALRGNTISFIPPYENLSNASRNDFKYEKLQAASWLRYATADKPKSETNDKAASSSMKVNALFNGAFSSFAPSTDNSRSLVTDLERSRQWWKKYGMPSASEAIFSIQTPPELASQVEDLGDISDKDFEDMVANFIVDDQRSESDQVLDEVSELIETLSSYQTIRGLEVARGPSSASKPSKDEHATYEMLRNQLQLLISSLPPFAVAKLNGDQLEELNISARILVTPPEFVGTGQVDEYTLRKNRAAQTATSAAGRNTVPTPSRTNYGTPASAYNAQARAYNNISNTAFNARPANAPMYNTPRPTANAQAAPYTQQYRSNGPGIHGPSIQQFQRPVVNGYGSAAAPGPQTPYMQRPSQPGYQQKAQDSASFSSVQKPVTNGDVSHYQQRSYGTPSNNYASNTTNGPGLQPQADTLKQRQASGTPQPQVPSTNGAIPAVSS